MLTTIPTPISLGEARNAASRPHQIQHGARSCQPVHTLRLTMIFLNCRGGTYFPKQPHSYTSIFATTRMHVHHILLRSTKSGTASIDITSHPQVMGNLYVFSITNVPSKTTQQKILSRTCFSKYNSDYVQRYDV